MALRLADWLAIRGVDISIFSVVVPRTLLDRRWDASAQATRGLKFVEWAGTCDAVIWTHSPSSSQLQWCDSRGIYTVVIPLWHDLRPEHREVYKLAHCVVCPSLECARVLRGGWRLSRVVALPWDPGTPIMRGGPDFSAGLSVLLPLFDDAVCRTEGTSLELCGRALESQAVSRVTVAYSSSKVAPFMSRRLKQLRRRFGSRLHLLRGCQMRDRPLIFHAHHVMLWPTHAENTGLLGLECLAAGTPVIGFAPQPVPEFLSAAVGVAVACTDKPNCVGVPIMDPQYINLEQQFHRLLRDTARLKSMRAQAAHMIYGRREIFERVLCDVFPSR